MTAQAELEKTTGKGDALESFAGLQSAFESAQRIGTQLNAFIEQNKMSSVSIDGAIYLRVDAWKFLASICGLAGRVSYCKPITDPRGRVLGYTARAEVVRISNGVLAGAAESECQLSEQHKGDLVWGENFEAAAVAQTRALSRAISQILRWVAVLAGYSGTPAEEMRRSINTGKTKQGGARQYTEKQAEKLIANLQNRWKRSAHPDKQTFGSFCYLATREQFNFGSAAEWLIGVRIPALQRAVEELRK